MLRREVTIENRTDKAVVLESAQSAAWYLPQGDGYRLRYLTGAGRVSGNSRRSRYTRA